MAEAIPRTRGRRRLLRELRRLRQHAGPDGAVMPLGEAGALIERSASALYRLEDGEVAKIRAGDVRALCEGYGASPELTADLVQLARETAKAPKGWWDAIGAGAAPWFTTLVQLEAEAARIDTWCPTLVPGLFQTEEYTRALMVSSAILTDPEEIERQVRIRMARQGVLKSPDGLQVWAVLDESVLHRVMGGPDVMREQLMSLIQASERPNVMIQLLPFSAGGHPALNGGPIVLFSFADADDPGVVYLENHQGALHLEEPPEVVAYRRLVEHVRSTASPAPATRDRIAKLAAAL